jgi:hypothetical protein
MLVALGAGVSTEDVFAQEPFRVTLDATALSVGLLSSTPDSSIPVQSTTGALTIGNLPTTTGYNGVLSNGASTSPPATRGCASWPLRTSHPAYAMLTVVVEASNHYRIWEYNGDSRVREEGERREKRDEHRV